jgi:TfoX/Sxy family transcriptional regulator of competence genes
MAFDEHLAKALRAVLAGRPEITERKMFGGPCFFLNGNMLCGAEKGRFMMRVGKEQEAAALARPGAEPMIFGPRKIGGFIWVSEDAAKANALAEWVARAEEFVGALEAK